MSPYKNALSTIGKSINLKKHSFKNCSKRTKRATALILCFNIFPNGMPAIAAKFPLPQSNFCSSYFASNRPLSNSGRNCVQKLFVKFLPRPAKDFPRSAIKATFLQKPISIIWFFIMIPGTLTMGRPAEREGRRGHCSEARGYRGARGSELSGLECKIHQLKLRPADAMMFFFF